MKAIDTISSELAERGWNLGELAFYERGVLVWQVLGHCGEQRVLVRVPSHEAAWRLAATQVVNVRREGFATRLSTTLFAEGLRPGQLMYALTYLSWAWWEIQRATSGH